MPLFRLHSRRPRRSRRFHPQSCALSLRFQKPDVLKTLTGALAAAAVLGLWTGSALSARAQDSGSGANGAAGAQGNVADKRVSIDAEDATLASVITTLMRSVGANYTLDDSLRQIRVTAHLHDLPLQTTLDVLLRSVAPPTTYHVENGIYRFGPRVEPNAPAAEGVAAPENGLNTNGIRHIQVARVNFIDAAEAARLLGGIPIRTSDGQTYGLVDPNKLGLVGPTNGGAAGAGAGGAAGSAGPAGAQGTGAAGATVPANFLDYLWIVNAGALR